MDKPNVPVSQGDESYNQGLIAWFARNHVAANLLLVFVCVLGFYAISILKKDLPWVMLPSVIQLMSS